MSASRTGTTAGRRGAGCAGFSLIEVILGMAIVFVAVVGLAQVFMLSVINNARSSEMTNATFLAQQQVDLLRTLTYDELSAFPSTTLGQSNDETIDMNGDGVYDFRRLTTLTADTLGTGFDVEVLVFPASQILTARATLLANPTTYKVRADVHTVISR